MTFFHNAELELVRGLIHELKGKLWVTKANVDFLGDLINRSEILSARKTRANLLFMKAMESLDANFETLEKLRSFLLQEECSNGWLDDSRD